MPIKVDHAKAKAVLLSEYEKTGSSALDTVAKQWARRVDHLGKLCPRGKSSTFIAALGTAILAKSVEPTVDVYSLLERGDTENSYSARSLADGVWAKQRAYLDIDLGANGSNPLNNIPFITRSRIDAIENVRNKEGQKALFECLDRLQALTNVDDARSALRGFIVSRTVKKTTSFAVSDDAGDYFIIQTLTEAIERFVSISSEGGRRAQATAAGLLSVAFGGDKVEVGHVNDPDRNFPLDITIFSASDKNDVRLCVEVKDKRVSGADLLSSVEKVVEKDIPNVLYLALNQPVDQRDFLHETKKAKQWGCRVSCIFTWGELCRWCISFSDTPGPLALGVAYREIGNRLVEMGVSIDGIKQWEKLKSG